MTQITACYCLFDECCLRFYYDESFKQLANRVNCVLNERYENEKKKGLCSFKHSRFYVENVWILGTAGMLGVPPEKRYVAYSDHVERIIDNMILNLDQEIYANEQCRNADKFFSQYRIKKRPSCFYFYQEDLISLSNFCFECKTNFVSCSEFKLKFVKIDRNGICGKWF